MKTHTTHTIKVVDVITTKTADTDKKGNIIFDSILEIVKGDPSAEIIVDFTGIELVNTAFLNNAVGMLFNPNKFNLHQNNVRISNVAEPVVDLIKETIAAARAKYG